ncbi:MULTISPECIES: SMP-30/gluconolactonase/LRE family protein [unclassified Azospirillum]|uniref:SMP-30/gluconolactonase/LRE family protein n=1 Tax=unclassified Azospirillum TaxID=2630922 RepID=UPI000B75E5EE|nr:MULTISPECIES: SMP-30/gluconolactonase/LRE family protein [unclassified Azospirillum]SNS68111.1 Sugar lactone lactonase YvrE [Azospirillum sp. RU38E]SNS86318.1 Sugar lactone lactonase YvrE [Azospirillum sp. RU37A]
MTTEPIDIVATRDALGEGVLWDDRKGVVWWTDIVGRRMHRWTPGGALETFPTPQRLGSFGLVEGMDALVCAFEQGFALFDPPSGRLHWIDQLLEQGCGIRFNDGRVGPNGLFWAGTMVEDAAKAGAANLGSQFTLAGDGTVTRHEGGFHISNGTCWSPDGATMYFADSIPGEMYAYDVDATTGLPANRRPFARTPDGASPDGATVDADGYLWSAQWGASRIVRFRPDGEIDLILPVPASQPTCVAFGGQDLDLLLVTTASVDLSEEALAGQPQAGNLLVYRTGHRGRLERRFTPKPGFPSLPA